MIKLTKLPIPDILAQNGAAWTTLLLEKQIAGETPTITDKSRYRHPQIKSTLTQETYGKCAYCESKFEHVTYGDIEHISPKSTELEAIFQWENLTLACDVCNTNKSDKFPRKEGLADPYDHDPEQRFHIHGPFIFAAPGDHDARYTEVILELNRTPLLERRKEKIKYLRHMLENVIVAPEKYRPALIEVLRLEISPDQEFSAVAKKYLSAYI